LLLLAISLFLPSRDDALSRWKEQSLVYGVSRPQRRVAAVTFTKAQAEAKIGKLVHVRRPVLAKYGIAPGRTGKVAEALAPYTGESRRGEDGWFVYVLFKLPDRGTQLLRLDKAEYEQALEEF